MATAASPATRAIPRPFKVALKHRVSPSPVHVEMREQRTPGGACSLRLLCSLTTSYETQQIGGPGPEVQDNEGPIRHEIHLNDVDLRSHDACRAAVLKLLLAIPAQGPVPLLDPEAGDWYKPVLHAAADDIVNLVTSGEEMRGYTVDVSLSVEENFMFVQPEALLLACEQAAIPCSQTPDERCAVCMECLHGSDARPAPVCMGENEKTAFTLPSCGHTFHRGCIAAWFEKGSTCPLCRCDMMYRLIDVEKQFGIRQEERDGRDTS